MIKYAEDIVKRISKVLIPQDIFLHINNVFTAIDKQIISEHETREKNGEVKFVDSKDILHMLQNQRNGV
jgi:hypothetical protein